MAYLNFKTIQSVGRRLKANQVILGLLLLAAGGGIVQASYYPISPTGNMGIGTSTPNAKFEIQKTNSYTPFMVSSSGTTDGDYLIVASSGNMGIGTTSPRGKLEINNTAAFSGEYDNLNSGTSKTIDWNNGNKQKLTLTGTCTLTFNALSGGVSNYQLMLVQDATGSRTVTWPAAVKWPGGAAPTLTTSASGVDIVSFYYNGTNYYGSASFDYK